MPDADYLRIPLHGRDGNVRAWTLIDAADASQAEHRWCLDGHGYAIRNIVREDGRHGVLYLHRVILELERGDGLDGDHLNRDRLDNRRSNLRPVTRAQNRQNVSAKQASTSKHRGVSWHKQSKRWRARCQHKYLGLYETEEEAASAAAAYRREHLPFAVD